MGILWARTGTIGCIVLIKGCGSCCKLEMVIARLLVQKDSSLTCGSISETANKNK